MSKGSSTTMLSRLVLAASLLSLTSASPTRTHERRANSTGTRPHVPTLSPSGTVSYPYTLEIAGHVARTDQDFVDGERPSGRLMSFFRGLGVLTLTS